MSRQAIPPAALDRFIESIRSGSTLNEACTAARIGRTTAYDYRRKDPAFAVRWEEAEAEGLDRLEGELYARAMDRDAPGSDRLLLFLLARRRPEVYGRSLDVNVSVEMAHSADDLRSLLAAAVPGLVTTAVADREDQS